MWRSGVARRRRHTALAEMVAAAVEADSFLAPWERSPHLWEFFSDEADVLRQLQQDWRAALAGAVYIAIERGQGDLQHDVLSALGQVRRRQRGARAILEAHADHPAIAAAMRKERALLACLSVAPTTEDSTSAA